MNIAVFILFMATLALVDGLTAVFCRDPKNQIDIFRCRHVLQNWIGDKNVNADWERYLETYGLCNDRSRTTQTFMTGGSLSSAQFCDDCKRAPCNSQKTVDLVYTVYLSFINNTNNCKVTRVSKKEQQQVNLTCNCYSRPNSKVKVRWIPVHYGKPRYN